MARQLHDILITAAHLAADVHRRVFARGNYDLPSKFNADSVAAADVVTLADKESEQVLRTYFARTMRGFNIFGEEYGAEYNGNGKVIVIDPLDGTALFRKGIPGFGPIIGVYDGGQNIGGVMYDVLRNDLLIGTLTSGFAHNGPRVEGMLPIASYDGSYFIGRSDELERRIRHVFPSLSVSSVSGLNGMQVFKRRTVAHMHAGLAWHDISAAPLFGKLTGISVTDHRGRLYDAMDPEIELKKYRVGTKAMVYSHPILLCRPEYLEGYLRILEPYADDLDKRKNPL